MYGKKSAPKRVPANIEQKIEPEFEKKNKEKKYIEEINKFCINMTQIRHMKDSYTKEYNTNINNLKIFSDIKNNKNTTYPINYYLYFNAHNQQYKTNINMITFLMPNEKETTFLSNYFINRTYDITKINKEQEFQIINLLFKQNNIEETIFQYILKFMNNNIDYRYINIFMDYIEKKYFEEYKKLFLDDFIDKILLIEDNPRKSLFLSRFILHLKTSPIF